MLDLSIAVSEEAAFANLAAKDVVEPVGADETEPRRATGVAFSTHDQPPVRGTAKDMPCRRR